MQVAAVFPAQVPPVQIYEVATGEQLAVSVDALPEVIDGGAATTVQTGGATGAVTAMDCVT